MIPAEDEDGQASRGASIRADGEREVFQHTALPGETSGRVDAWENKAEGGLDLSWKRQRFSTTILVNLSAIMERTDEQLLPAVYAFVAASFNASPQQLGYLTQSRALVQAVASPFGGLAGYYFNRVWVIAVGCSIWGCMTALFSGCSSTAQGYVLWAINGIGLSLVIPTGQSLTADYYTEATRGRAFGALYLTGAFGAMLGAIYATNLGHLHVLGFEGWRFAFFTVAMISLLIGLLNLLFARDPRCKQRWALQQDMSDQLEAKTIAKELKEMCLMPTFLIIILQGIVGSTPWNALVFLTLYLQTLGMSDSAASILVSLFLGSTALGGMLGGYLGDLAAAKFPSAGRIAVVQFSVLVGVPLSAILFKGLPLDGRSSSVALYGMVLFCMGLLISWAAPACNNPIFSEIVPPHLRTVIYAFDRSFESAVAASAAPIVGLLAEQVYGWEGSATPKGVSIDTDLDNARALGNAMLVCTTIPWTLCVIFYAGLYFTYPTDRAKAVEAASRAGDQESEPLQLEQRRENGAEKRQFRALSPLPAERHQLTSTGQKFGPSLELTAVGSSDQKPAAEERLQLLEGRVRSDQSLRGDL